MQMRATAIYIQLSCAQRRNIVGKTWPSEIKNKNLLKSELDESGPQGCLDMQLECSLLLWRQVGKEVNSSG